MIRVTGLRFAFGFTMGVTFLAVPVPPGASADPSAESVASHVDELLMRGLLAESPTDPFSERTDDDTFLRRVSLDLVGELPSPEEITLFSLNPDPHKRRQMVDQFLRDRRFGENWARYWRDVIMYRRTEERALVSARALESYLTEQLNQNTPWSQVAHEVITAKGNVREKGNTALIMAQGGEPENTAAEVARIFLGMQIQCAQCHDHPYDRWKRDQFHELAAFFPRVAIRPDRSSGMRTFNVVANDSPPRRRRQNNNNRFRGTLEHHMPDLDNPRAKGTLMHPVLFTTGQQLGPERTDDERRDTLARWMTSPDNLWFAKAFVNRMWAELVGEGFYEPVDDMGPDRPCSAPETLEHLATAFVETGYDVKWLFQTTMATQAYQRESRSRRNYDQAPFTANCAQRLRADQLLNVLTAALDINEQGIENGRGRRSRSGRGDPRTRFNLAFGYDPSEPRDDVTGSIPQALSLMNSPQINSAVSARRYGGLGNLIEDIQDDVALVAELYLRCLARQPTESESKVCLEYVDELGNRDEAFEDILWTLINSTEFLHRK